jgi:hypothetical protein
VDKKKIQATIGTFLTILGTVIIITDLFIKPGEDSLIESLGLLIFAIGLILSSTSGKWDN